MMLNNIDYENVKTAFTSELRLAAEGKPSSLSFIEHTLPEQPHITTGIFQGIVIGGTNYVVSTRRILKTGKTKTLTLKYGTLPVFKDRTTLVDFLSHHLNSKADAVGINFGFPLKPLKGPFGEIDAKLLRGTKEHKFIGVTSKIGDIVREIYEVKFKKAVLVTVANDSVCLTLSGDGTENGSLIVGTGCNMCLKVRQSDVFTVVNLEAGNFNKFPLSPTLKKLDKKSTNPGLQLLEKSVSGQYLSLYFNEKAKELGLEVASIDSTKELSELAEKQTKKRETLLAQDLLRNSAYLVAAMVAGAYEFADSPPGFTLITEGSVFWKGWKYQEHIQEQLLKLKIPADAIRFKHVRDSSILGAIGLLTK